MGAPLYDLIAYYVNYSVAAFKMHNTKQYILLSLLSMFKHIHHYITGRNSGNFAISKIIGQSYCGQQMPEK